MITLQEFCQNLNELFEISKFDDYCENGLQVEGKKHVTKVATAVSASLETIEAAASSGVEALVVHHGLFWKGDKYSVVRSKKDKLKTLLDHGISLLGYHLPMDAHRELGNNWKAAHDMGWVNLKPFGQLNGVSIGVKGEFEPISRNDFQQKIETYYEHSASKAAFGENKVKSAALISGGAYKMLGDAALEGVECFVTGNYDEPAWYQAQEEGINFYALGHSATERIGPKSLCDYISKQFGVECQFIDILNPF